MLSLKKYHTRLHMKKIKQVASITKDIFKAVDKFIDIDWTDESVKNILLEELESTMTIEPTTPADDVKKKLATMLGRLIEGKNIESETEEEKEMTDEEFVTCCEKKETVIELEKTSNESSTETAFEPTEAETTLPTAQQPPSSIARSLPNISQSFFVNEEQDSRLSTVTPMITTSMDNTMTKSFNSTRTIRSRRIRSSFDLARQLLLDESIICLGTPVRSPVAIITLEDTPETSNIDQRKFVSMERSSPQSPWPT